MADARTFAYQPSSKTAIDTIQPDRREAILAYVDALQQAIDAGVAAGGIKSMQAYLDTAVATRVQDARDDERWAKRSTEMDRDIARWAVRDVDHQARAVKRDPVVLGASKGVVELLSTARRLPYEDVETLEAVWRAAGERDCDRVEILLPRIAQPWYASLRYRAVTKARRLEGYAQLRLMLCDLPGGAQHAALALLGKEVLSQPEHAILYGPWAEVVEGDPSVLDWAWTAAADELRADFRAVPVEAWQDASDDPDL